MLTQIGGVIYSGTSRDYPIDNTHSVIGIGNLSCGTGIAHHIRVAFISQKRNNFKKWPKVHTFLTKLKQYLPNKSTCTLLNRLMLYTRPSPNSLYGNKLLQSLSEAFFPQQIGDFKMVAFWSFFTVSSTLEAV